MLTRKKGTGGGGNARDRIVAKGTVVGGPVTIGTAVDDTVENGTAVDVLLANGTPVGDPE